jgi:hypothetical protein
MVTHSPIDSTKDSMHWSSVTMFLFDIMVALNSLTMARNLAFSITTFFNDKIWNRRSFLQSPFID